MGEAKRRKSEGLIYHHTSTLRSNLIWMAGVIDLEGRGKDPLHPSLGRVGSGASLRRGMAQFPPVAWFTSKIEVPTCVQTLAVVVVGEDGEQRHINLSKEEAMAVALNRLSLGFPQSTPGLVRWPDHHGFATDEGRELNASAEEAGDDPNDWWVSEAPVDVMEATEVRVSRSIFSTKLERSEQYLRDVKRMVQMCRDNPGIYIPPSWLTQKQGQQLAQGMNLPVADFE